MEYIIVGKIINSHGIDGELKIYPYTNNIKRFSNLENAYIGQNYIKVTLERVRYYKDMVILKFKEFNNINKILNFKGDFLYIDIGDSISLPKDHYFIYDLIDCSVVDNLGNKLGYIKDVLQYSSNDVYLVKNSTTNKEYLIPAVKEFIKGVNISKKEVIISPIEGMIE